MLPNSLRGTPPRAVGSNVHGAEVLCLLLDSLTMDSVVAVPLAQEQSMTTATSPRPVVVAIDGSSAAIGAAVWAAKDALHHDVPLRMVHVVHIEQPSDSASGYSIDDEYAETSLREACSAVAKTGIGVQIETTVLHGGIESLLIEESRGATLICLGSTGIGRICAKVLGSTAATVAERACCPVAIIRCAHDEETTESGFIAVIVDDLTGDGEAMLWAMEEARVRHAPVLALGSWPWPLFDIDYERFGQRLDHWLRRYPDVTVEIATTRMSAMRYLESYVGALQLVVISDEDPRQVMDLVGPRTVSMLKHANCSVLVARPTAPTTAARRYQREPETETVPS